jgi:peptidoglycan/LPS O-acetylase OafA/YrhL
MNTAFLNGLRFILALWVAAGHFYKYIGGTAFIRIPVIGGLILNNGPAVDGFMIVTGFLMMYHYLKREAIEPPEERSTFTKFWLRRLFRLYPLYALALIAAYLVFDHNAQNVYYNYQYFTGKPAHFETTYSPAFYPRWRDLLLHLTFLHGLLPGVNTSILGPAWSLSLEMQFYLLFPFIYLLFFRNERVIRTRMVPFTLATILLALMCEKLLGNWHRPGLLLDFGAPSLLFYKLHYFLLGMLLAAFGAGRVKLFHLNVWMLVILPVLEPLTVLIILSIVLLLFSEQIKAYVPAFAAQAIERVKQALSGRTATLGADVSYSLYLIHMILMPGVIRFVIDHSSFSNKIINAVMAGVVFLALNIALSYVLFLAVEKPFIAIGKRYLGGRSRVRLTGDY